MIARYPGTCCETGKPIHRGDKINFYGRGRAALVESAEDCIEHDEDESAGFEPGTLASDRRSARNGLTVIRLSSGHVMTQNSRGRCEDAPCCGCCS